MAETSEVVADTCTAVYRLYDENETLLYVGCTDWLVQRFSKHAADKPWWPEVARRGIEWHPDRHAALVAEARAIRDEKPRHNRTNPFAEVPAAEADELYPADAAWLAPVRESGNADPQRAYFQAIELIEESERRRGLAARLRTEMAYRMREAEGLTLQQLADRLGISRGTAQILVEREIRAQRPKRRRVRKPPE